MPQFHVMMRISIVFICYLISNVAFSQSKKQLLEVANEAYSQNQFQATIEILEDFTAAYPSEYNAAFLLAKSYYEINNFEEAQNLLKKIYNKDRDRKYPESSYLLAQSYQQLGNYRYAKRYYQRALTPYRRDRGSFKYIQIKQAIASCEFANQLKQTPYPFSNIEGDINTNNAEYGFIAISESLALYSSIITEKEAQKSKIFLTEKVEGVWQRKQELNFGIDEELLQVANPFYHQKTNTLFFSLCDTNRMCNIAYAKFDTINELLPSYIKSLKTSNYTNTQPTVASINNNDYLIYTSNRPDGVGGLDLWASEMANGNFQEPFVLNESINSLGDELTPFYKEGQLYFSSNWHKNLGGFDVFKIKTDLKTEFGNVENFIEVNSPSNDLYFSSFKNQYFLTSNRDGAITNSNNYCCNDLFYFINDSINEPKRLDSLQTHFPLILFFDNDEPKANETYDISYKDYNELLKDYRKEKNTYFNRSKASIIERDDLEEFFDWQLPQEEQLIATFSYLKNQLALGDTITLLVQGFSSALASKEYNFQLSERRINSFIQSLVNFEDNLFSYYLENNQLVIKKEALGEGEIDNKNNDLNSIYAIESMLDRRIEIKAIRHKKK